MAKTKMKVLILFLVIMSNVSISSQEVTVLQPDPDNGKDIWTTNIFYGSGGLDNEWLQIGGWDDSYYSLLEFDLSGLPATAQSVTLELYVGQSKGTGTTSMYLDRITEFWDWKTQGTGSDFERLWWADRPATTPWIAGTIPPPIVGQWYSIDITGLYNGWQAGTYPNYGLQLRPTSTINRWNEFYSSDYLTDPALRPKLVITGFPCCNGIRGNVDSDALDQIDISDLVGLVAYMFQGGEEPPCMDEADIDGSGGIDISDLVGLVSYMFQGGTQPANCP